MIELTILLMYNPSINVIHEWPCSSMQLGNLCLFYGTLASAMADGWEVVGEL